ncbi:hypothetical protein PHACT_14520 [Pseudohongiella acticola]|jgi:hypothetical protein|uniref:Uncharacterized protein n=1 Tax=Pseudohongiella acticola TaxID=1524254 RepID=A0A1E8CFF1_9GAMM|nr:hypothetical protein [Pseudohongiella acticola]OFE11076.1 hypothetical protein PHACT_14520 [Pseudohongiella acticola]
MSDDTNNTLTEQRFAELLAAYGADATRWPEAERSAALAFMDNNVNARGMMRDALPLDQWMRASEASVPAFSGLEARILQRALPVGASAFIDRLVGWCLPASGFDVRQLWRPLAAASLPLAIGLMVGFQVELSPDVYATTVEQELYLISLSDYAEIL